MNLVALLKFIVISYVQKDSFHMYRSNTKFGSLQALEQHYCKHTKYTDTDIINKNIYFVYDYIPFFFFF